MQLGRICSGFRYFCDVDLNLVALLLLRQKPALVSFRTVLAAAGVAPRSRAAVLMLQCTDNLRHDAGERCPSADRLRTATAVRNAVFGLLGRRRRRRRGWFDDRMIVKLTAGCVAGRRPASADVAEVKNQQRQHDDDEHRQCKEFQEVHGDVGVERRGQRRTACCSKTHT
jgi:hypothetical protein